MVGVAVYGAQPVAVAGLGIASNLIVVVDIYVVPETPAFFVAMNEALRLRSSPHARLPYAVVGPYSNPTPTTS
jgi:hypothetical protein